MSRLIRRVWRAQERGKGERAFFRGGPVLAPAAVSPCESGTALPLRRGDERAAVERDAPETALAVDHCSSRRRNESSETGFSDRRKHFPRSPCSVSTQAVSERSSRRRKNERRRRGRHRWRPNVRRRTSDRRAAQRVVSSVPRLKCTRGSRWPSKVHPGPTKRVEQEAGGEARARVRPSC
ncbi:hypothetical protein AAT19DRAFT_16715, partial [Rhodotorula toruloides]